jgi:hypothetical protein
MDRGPSIDKGLAAGGKRSPLASDGMAGIHLEIVPTSMLKVFSMVPKEQR